MQAALATALSLEGPDGHEAAVADPRASPEALVLVRHDLRLLAHSARALSPDQRLVLAHQLANTSCRAFCQQFGWSPEKYRKVAQRGRARLKRLASTDDPHVPFGD